MKHFCSFSEAIREGAKIRPQGRETYFNDGRSCAFGAGMEATFESPTVEDVHVVTQLHPYLYNGCETCPACPDIGPNETLTTVIFHLNDDHQWTREQIADWLESEEEKLGYVTLVESESSSESIPAEAVLSV